MKNIQLATGLEPNKVPSDLSLKHVRDILHECAKADETRKFNSPASLQAKQTQNSLSNDERSPVGQKIPVLGSKGKSYFKHDVGFFETVLMAYNNHWTLKTCPEDWWYCIIQKIAGAIDKNSKSDEVRKFFVNHDGKKKLTVQVGPSIYGVDYSWFFEQMSEQIARNIKVPKYVGSMRATFSGTTKAQKIISEIAIMSSMQEFFDFGMCLMCGIPSIVMSGLRDDWKLLGTKLQELKTLLEPIDEAIELTYWWPKVEKVCQNLLDTFDGHPDQDWWSRIITYRRNFGSGPAEEWSGWFLVDFLGEYSIENLKEVPSGLVSVPMTITDGVNEEKSAIVAGIVGFKLHQDECPSVEAVHGWSLMCEPNSIFRADIENWEKSHAGA